MHRQVTTDRATQSMRRYIITVGTPHLRAHGIPSTQPPRLRLRMLVDVVLTAKQAEKGAVQGTCTYTSAVCNAQQDYEVTA